MPWSGGTFSPLWSWVVDAVTFPNMLPSRFDEYDDDQATGINNCIAKDGQNTATANLPMGTFRHTNVGSATARNQYATVAQLQDNAFSSSEEVGSADTYVMGLSPAITEYADQMVVWMVPANTNTGASTLNINGVGATSIKIGSDELEAGQLVAGRCYALYYDGSAFQLLNFLEATVPILETGDITYSWATSKTGWVLATGSIGSASSGATTRANADTEDLYTLFWTNLADAQAPVAGGRGASAAADFAANKALTMPDGRGRALIGKDNMGGSAANRITSGVSGLTGTTLGAAGGDQNVSPHTLVSNVTDSGHYHLQGWVDSNSPPSRYGREDSGISNSTADSGGASTSNFAGRTSTVTTGITVATTDSATGTAANVQPSLVANVFYKL